MLDWTGLSSISDWDRPDWWNHWKYGGQERGKRYIRGAEQQWLRQSSAFSIKKPAHPHLDIYRGKLWMFVDSTPHEMASAQEWESLGGAAAPLFTRHLLFLFRSFIFHDCSSVG